MHGRTWLAPLVLAVTGLLSAPALAAPMPAGVYETQLTGGSLKVGKILSPLPIAPTSSFPLAIGTSPLGAQVSGITVQPQQFTYDLGPLLGTANGSYTFSVQTLAITLDPTTGSATIDTSLYGSITLTSPVSGTCYFGSSQLPIGLHLSTANGSAWDPTTNAMSLVDKTFALPTPDCSDSSLASIAAVFWAVNGGSNVGDNALTTNWRMARRADVITTPGRTGGSGPGGTGGTGTQQPGATTPSACVVPKLKGRRLGTRKARNRVVSGLRKSGCRLGKIKRVKSKGRAGTVVGQKPAPGKKLKAGSRIDVTVARGA